MSEQFESIMNGLNDLLEYTKGDKSKGRSKIVAQPDLKPLKVYNNYDIKKLRISSNMTQKVFAEIIGVTPKAVEAWECGRTKPSGSVIRLFQLLESDKVAILENLMIK